MIDESPTAPAISAIMTSRGRARDREDQEEYCSIRNRNGSHRSRYEKRSPEYFNEYQEGQEEQVSGPRIAEGVQRNARVSIVSVLVSLWEHGAIVGWSWLIVS